MDQPTTTKGEETLVGKYQSLETNREPYLRRARDCAKVTIPTLMPEFDSKTGTQTFITPYQSVGARGINNISSKLLLSLFPPNQPFFKLDVDEQTLVELKEKRSDAEKAFSIIEKRVVKAIHASPTVRVQALEAIKQLINSGNVLVYLPPKENTLRIYRLDRYVTERDASGNVLCIVVKEDLAPVAMPEAVRMKLEAQDNYDAKKTENLSLYTQIKREDKQWVVTQECEGVDLTEDNPTTYPLEESPWLSLRLIAVDNEDYGRSYVEEYYGDLLSLEGLMQAIVEGSAAAAKVLFLVSPNGTTRKATLDKANNLDIIEGDVNDVNTLSVDKAADFRVALETANGIIERLSFAFLLNSAVQRNGERVTAEEIRYVASELEDSLGGIYSSMAQDFQLPLVSIYLKKLTRQGKIPKLPKDVVMPTIVTGMEALGRTAELQKLDMFIQSLAALGEDQLMKFVNISELIKRRATALQIETDGLIKTPEELEAEAQAAQQQQMQQQMMSGAIPNATKAIGDAVNNAQQQPPQ